MSSALDGEVFFLQVKAERRAAEHPDIGYLAAHLHTRAFGRHVRTLRQNGHLAGAIVNLVKAERHERDAPGRGDDAFDVDGVILIAARVLPKVGDMRAAERSRARGHLSLIHISEPTR